jgi:Tol biopolymer transport system component
MDVSLWAIRFDGSEEHALFSQDDFNAMPLHPDINADDVLSNQPYQMAFIPGSQTLAFNTYPQFEGPGLFDNKDLWYVDVETGTRTNVLPAGQAGHFHFSPDGSQIALVTPEDISLINSDGSNRRDAVLTYPFVYTYSEYAYHAEPVWAADGSYLRVTIPPQDPLGDLSALGHIYQIPTDGSAAVMLGSLPLGLLNYGHFSPDLSQIAYLERVGEPEENIWALQFANYDGSGSTEFIRGNISFLSWAPDSDHFAFEQRSPRAIVLGQTGSAGTTMVDVNPSLKLSWISDTRYFFQYQTAPEDQLRLGRLGAPSTVVANLGSGSFNIHYDFVSP